jgi:DNA-directed DNA polymerase III PolC
LGNPLSEPPPYAELHCLTNFTFLRGASHPEELVDRARQLGYAALAITDECSVAGVVRAHMAAKETPDAAEAAPALRAPLKLLIGAEFRLTCGMRFVALATDRRGYGRLCSLITRGRRAAPKGEYTLARPGVESSLEQCLILWLPDLERPDPEAYLEAASWLKERFRGKLWIAVETRRGGADRKRLASLAEVSRTLGLPLVASGNVHMHVRERRRLQDALTAIRLNVPLTQAGWNLNPNGERYLRERARLARLYPSELLAETLAVAERCTFSLAELRYEYPREIVPEGETPATYLRKLVEQGAQMRWPQGMPERARGIIEHELELIAELAYEPYFLTVHDIVAHARSRGILCQGRGSAANSLVCYCLAVTAVGLERSALLIERFISKERNEPPDIDIDFEHERREEVLQYVYGKYGRERAAIAATVIMYRPRSCIRDLGKVFGLDPLEIRNLSRLLQWWDPGVTPERIREAGFDPESPLFRLILQLARELIGFPRHLSQHVGGFVISAGPLDELVPTENAAMPDRTVVQWDKDDLNDLGLLKVDLLGLGMLSALRRALELVNAWRGTKWTLGHLPPEDRRVYEMMSRADTVGVFQIESRAQMAMLPRLKPKEFYDLVIEVAIVRPGPIQGDMVHPYLRRREGNEEVVYPRPEVKEVLERTLGVPIFQEQVMQLAIKAAGFTPGEADRLRRAMAAWKRHGDIHRFQEKLLRGMTDRGYSQEFALRLCKQIEGFGEYGFPECVVGETRVVDADTGQWLTIEEVISDRARLTSTLACDDDLRLRKRKVLAVVPSGVKTVRRLRTVLGHTIVATAEHPLMTLSGWRKLGELRVGDYVAAVRAMPVLGLRRWARHRILVLADLIAQGNLCPPDTVYFYTTAQWHCEEFVRSVERFPNTRAVVERHKSCFSVRVRRKDRKRPTGAVTWLRALGMWGLDAREKHLPSELFELRNSGIALFLARLWEGGGGFSARGGASYDTASQRLSFEVQHLLLRLGIVARRHCRVRSYKGRKPEHFVVTVTGKEPLQRFWKLIGRRFLDLKKRQQSQILARQRREGRKSRDVIPAEVRKIIRRETALNSSPDLLGLANSEIYWDEVLEIETLGAQPTYDLQIEGNHNFLANNLVVHNSHACSFALLVYDSAWLKCHEPAAFTCALLNSQPMGFYAPAQLARDAREHGVEVRPVRIDASEWECTLEPRDDQSRGGPGGGGFRVDQPALRLGLRLVKSLSQAAAERIVAVRKERPFASVQDLAERAALDRGDLEALAAAGALAPLSGNRHLAFWEVAGTERPLALAPRGTQTPYADAGRPLLTMPTERESIAADYASLGLTLGRHPMALLRERLRSERIATAAELSGLPDGQLVRTAGIVLLRQHPTNAKGVTFVTLEDETGQVNLIVWQRVGETQRRPLVESRLLEVRGKLQRQGSIMHVVAHRLIDRSELVAGLTASSRDFH